MANVKGKFITLACSLMGPYPESQAKANSLLLDETGKNWTELGPDSWYDTGIFHRVMELYAHSSVTGYGALVTLGKKVYPTIKKGGGIPAQVATPLDFIKFEAEGFLQNHQGADVTPRRFLTLKEREVVVQAPAPGYNEKLFEGVYLGILDMCGVTTGQVTNTGNSTLRITW